MTSNKLPRVIYVASPELFSRGASSIHVMKMCQAMARLGVDTELLIPANKPIGEICRYYGVEPNFKITSFPYFTNTLLRNVTHGTAASLFIKTKRREYDIVVTRNIVFAYCATKLFKIPTVYDAHHPLVKGASRLFNSFKNSPHLVRFSTNSAGLADIYLRHGLPTSKLTVAHNGVDLKGFEKAPSKEQARKKLGLPLNGKIVCYSGNIYEGRGIELLIDASLRLEEVTFLIVGGLEEDVKVYRDIAQKKRADNIQLVGFVPHESVPTYLLASDILVMPYTSSMTIKGGTKAAEFTSPIKLFEYMAAGRPIVATSLPTVHEILRHKENAVLVNPDSAESLCEGLREVLDNPALACAISERAQSDVRGYTWEERAKKLLGLP